MQQNAPIDFPAICARITQAIDSANMSGRQLAMDSGVCYRTISAIRAGTAKLRGRTIHRLARVLRVDPRVLSLGMPPRPEHRQRVLREMPEIYGRENLPKGAIYLSPDGTIPFVAMKDALDLIRRLSDIYGLDPFDVQRKLVQMLEEKAKSKSRKYPIDDEG